MRIALRQALLVFRKDVRHLWPQVALALALTALLALLDCSLSSSPFTGVAEILWAIWWSYLGAAVIQEEPLPGDRQYWVTRPYSRGGLLLAKMLFLALFAGLPILAAGAAALAANGISPLRHLPLLASSAAAFAGGIVLAAAALASVTETLRQFVWAWLALGAAAGGGAILATRGGAEGWGAQEWVRVAAVGAFAAVAAGSALALQYGRRRTARARGILAVAALLMAAAPFANAWHAAWALESGGGSGRAEAWGIRLSFDGSPPGRVRYTDAPYFPASNEEGLYLPARVTGIPAGTAVVGARIAAAVEAGGATWRTGWTRHGGMTGADPSRDVHMIRADGPCRLYIDVDRAFYQAVKETPARVHISVALTLLGGRETARIRPGGRTSGLPGEGICDVTAGGVPMPAGVKGIRDMRNLLVACAWPWPGPGRAYVRATLPHSGPTVENLLPTGSRGALPVRSVRQQGSSIFPVREGAVDLDVETWRAAAYLERDLEIPAIRLRDYAAPRATDPLW
jgi:hypothetical protein